MNDDAALLRRYVNDRSEAALGELVQRHLNLVYFAALRRTGGNTGLAEDIAQAVFTSLAREAGALVEHTALTGWLYTTTRNIALKTIRGEQRRQTREQEAHLMHDASLDSSAAVDWERLRPLLDEALDELNDRDREAVLWRCWDGRAYAEIGTALRISEDAARMRVDRALDKLREGLARRGLTSTGAALATALGGQAALAAPGGLAATVTAAALAHAGIAGGGVAVAAKVAGFMSTAKIMTGVAAIVAVAATALVVRQQQATAELRAEVTALRGQGDTAATLRAENQRLITEKRAVEDAARVEHEELVKLQAAREAFRKQLAARRGDPASATVAGVAEGVAVGGGVPPGMISVDMMKNVGNQTANAAAETLVWAMQNGDVKRAAAMLTMAPAEREKLAAFIQTLPANLREQYGTPEEVMAFLLAGSPKPMGAVQLLGMDQVSADEAVHHVQVQFQNGDFRRDDVTFRRDADGGWKQVVSPTTVDRLITYFQGKK